jgi:site-specific recombinase XerD
MKNRGLYEKVTSSGEWWIRYADATGRIRREKAGTRAAARDLYIKRKAEALQGRKLPEKLRRAPVTFREIADEAIADIRKRYSRPGDDIVRLERMKEWFRARSAESITPQEIEVEFERAEKEKGWAPSTVNHHRSVLSLAYRLAMRATPPKVKENPVRNTRHRKEDNERVRYLTAEEEDRLRKVLRSKPEWAGHEPELDLALNTGLRRTDMYRRLVWGNVNLELRVATIPRSKNQEPVYVPLNDAAIRTLLIFRSRGDGTGRVVRNAAGDTLNFNAYWFVDAVRAAGIKDFRWHDLRHTFASRLRQAGEPLETIAELLGHKGLAMTKRYAHLSAPHLHAAVARLSQSRTDTRTDTEAAERPKSRAAYVN